MAWIVKIVIALAVLWSPGAWAQTYPSKPIHILVPYAPGGITDIASRIIGAAVSRASSDSVSLPVFLACYFFTLWISWLIAVRVSEKLRLYT